MINNNTFVSPDLPVEIWADWLEEQGQDTSDLRAWITMGLAVDNYGHDYGISYYYNSNYNHSNNGYGNGNKFSYGNRITIANGYGSGIGNGNSDSYGDGYSNGNGYGHGN